MTARGHIAAALFALVWFSVAWFGSWELNPNNATRLFAAISLVEQHDATIDEFAPLTIDKAQFGDHYYLDKAPGMTLLAVPAVVVGNLLTGERATALDKTGGDTAFARYLRLRLRIAVAIGPAVLTALAAVLIMDMGAALTGSAAAGLFAALGYALGTPIWGWSTTILGHAPVAALYVVALWAIWRATSGASPGRSGLLAGLSLGAAVTIEYQAALAGSGIALWALWAMRGRAGAARFVAMAALGGLIGVAPVALYNLAAFGTVFRVGYSGVVGFEGMQQGFFGLGWPRPFVIGAVSVGFRRGLFWVAPILALAPYGLAMWLARPKIRSLSVAILAVVGVTLLVNAAYVYWDGGNATGPRLTIPMVGAFALGLAAVWAALPHRGWHIAAASLLGLSIALNLAIASADIFAPPEFAFPIWTDILAGRFARGELQTVASDWWGWSTWAGLWLWALVALPVIARLVRLASIAYPDAPRVTGASGSPQGSAG